MTDKKLPHGLFTEAELRDAEARVERGEAKNVKEAAELVKADRVAPYAFMSDPDDKNWSSVGDVTDGRIADQSYPPEGAAPSVGEVPSVGKTIDDAVADELRASENDALTAEAFMTEEGLDAEAAAEYDAERVAEAEAAVDDEKSKRGGRR